MTSAATRLTRHLHPVEIWLTLTGTHSNPSLHDLGPSVSPSCPRWTLRNNRPRPSTSEHSRPRTWNRAPVSPVPYSSFMNQHDQGRADSGIQDVVEEGAYTI